ncbi:probable E3 ubiquitin-protein ligase makorin-1 [Condylostylus longicornis]|uniref:probable E3 ubiquitin-protein ligase makorin-1 n=1 Tax=Condylostylus longicornis TaxID=2530218 RepID=UPI00244DBEAC|nr:probable E3 ubiquitin-protein ligase makorin-1 [Condylostylus longicornis]
MATRSPIVCRFYTRGICRFGDLCRFSHPGEVTDGISTDEDRAISILATTSTSNQFDENQQAQALQPLQNTNQQNDWAMAPVFVPKNQSSQHANNIDFCDSNLNKNFGTHSYAEIAGGSNGNAKVYSEEVMCPFAISCPYGNYCSMIHGELCDMCGHYCLHPTDKVQRKKHINECLQQHEKDMELSFAIARSKNKTCGICFDIIMEKNGKEKRFGILPNCNHIFCLECIRKWRQAKQFENKITRSCPECRISSDFVCPSAFWVENKDDKDKVINEYKNALGDKDCKYFNKGEGKCPFGNKCFYKHALPNGIKVDVGVPQKRKVYHHLGLMEIFSDFSFYELITNRDVPSLIEYWSNFEIDSSDDSDWPDETN